MAALVNEPLPAGIAIAVAADSPVFTRTPPATPAAPVWMCASIAVLPFGNPLTVNCITTVPAVIVDPLRVTLNVIVELPLAPASAFVIGGTSLDARNAAVNVMTLGSDAVGDDGLFLSLHDVAIAPARISTAIRFIESPPDKRV